MLKATCICHFVLWSGLMKLIKTEPFQNEVKHLEERNKRDLCLIHCLPLVMANMMDGDLSKAVALLLLVRC